MEGIDDLVVLVAVRDGDAVAGGGAAATEVAGEDAAAAGGNSFTRRARRKITWVSFLKL